LLSPGGRNPRRLKPWDDAGCYFIAGSRQGSNRKKRRGNRGAIGGPGGRATDSQQPDEKLLAELAGVWADALEACRGFRKALEKAERLGEHDPHTESHAAVARKAEDSLLGIGYRLRLGPPRQGQET
jgi:hypothetical protein